MQFETFDQLFKFRPKCLCGDNTKIRFQYNQADSNNTITLSSSGGALLLSVNILSNYGQSKLHITSYISSPNFISTSYYTDNGTRAKLSAIEFSKSQFTPNHQIKNYDAMVVFDCPNGWPNKTGCRYQLMTDSVIFEFSPSFNCGSGKIKPIQLRHESYFIDDCRVTTDYTQDITILDHKMRSSAKTGSPIELSATHFSKFPFERESLSKKIKLLTLLS